jgi:hypothetical protein
LQEQKRENAKQRKVIEDLAIRTKQKEKDAAMTLHKETLKTGGSTKTKKKKASKKKELEPTSEDEVEIDDLESCKIIKHKTDKRQGEIKVEVKWDDSGKTNWQYLYDMWADYPGEVKDYKKKNQTKCKGKLWKVPNMGDVEYFVRILGMLGGSENVKKAEFIVLANNGYKFDGEDCVKYDELQADDPKLLQAFLDSVEDSPEADDTSIALCVFNDELLHFL